MANYSLKFHFADGGVLPIVTGKQPDDLTEFIDKLVASTYQTYVDPGSTHAAIVNMNNVTNVDITKVNMAIV